MDFEKDGADEEWVPFASRVGQSWAGPPLSVCSDTSVRVGQLLRAGDDRLIQTHSNAMNPNGSIREIAPSLVFRSVLCV